ncbi:MAG: Type IV pilus assembly protein PilB [Parcubacteria group bacterium GW2011_GWF2_39_13b]|nr:MAG: Type IV pilus assembly protein PilB [Parcubacteria group bacterium GW2011_GWF2_39_13b]
MPASPKIDLSEGNDVKKKAEALGLPFINLTGKTIPNDVLREIPEESAIFYQIIPFAKDEKVLKVGLVDPNDLQAQEALRFITLRSGLKPEIHLISQNDFDDIIKQYRNLKEEVGVALQQLKKEVAREKEGVDEEKKEARRVGVEAPISKIVAVMLKYAQDGRASDIHIEPFEKDLKIRYRVDGVLFTSLVLPKATHPSITSRIKILSNLKIDETRIPQDGRFQAAIGDKKIDFRVSVLPTIHGEKTVLRILDSSTGLMGFEQLGLVSHNLEELRKAIKQPFGMILITGPTGSGKSTTLYAILKELNQEGVNIISLEDPVEYHIEGVNQSQIKPEINYTFASGLRSILRQDPDIIMVGEIRDSETAGLAVHAALTGHILLSTLHTNNAVGVIPRLVDMGVESFLVPSSLNLSIAQRLVRRLCDDCKKEIKIEAKVLAAIDKELENLPEKVFKDLKISKPYKIFNSPGCKFCSNKGTKGRIAIYEVLSMTKELEKIVIDGPTEQKIVAEANRQGMITMKQDGFLKVLQGIISMEEVLRAVEE